MKILFLGTSAGWPLPRLGCNCKICTSKDPKDKRWRSSVLINDSILIDAGPDIHHQIFRLPKTPLISFILITHTHGDHIYGLRDLTHLYHPQKTRQRQKPLLISTKDVLKTAQKRFSPLDYAFYSKKVCPSFKKINIATDLSVMFIPVDHSLDIATFAIKIIEKKKSLIYIPDFRAIPKESLKFCRNAEILVLDGSNIRPAGPKHWGHMPIEKSIPLAKKLKAKNIYYTHIGHGPKSGTHQELENFVQKNGGKNFHVAYDGLELTI